MVDERPGRRGNKLDIERIRRIENPIPHRPFTCVHTLEIILESSVEDEGAWIHDCVYCHLIFAELLKIRLYLQ